MNNAQYTGIWEDSTIYGSLSLNDDFKSNAWSTVLMNQFLIKDNGSSQRNLLKTLPQQIPNQTLSTFFSLLQWGSTASDISSSAYSNNRVKSLNIATFNISDNVFAALNKSKILLKFGEKDGVQDNNKDRMMISWNRYDALDSVDNIVGIGCFTLLNGTQYYRDIMPIQDIYDYPKNSISGAPYIYSIWVK